MRKFLTALILGGFLVLSLSSQKSYAGEVDLLLQKLVEKGVLTPGEAQQIGTETKEQIKAEIAQGKSSSLPAWVQNTKLKGDFRLREEWRKNKGSDDLSRTRIRLRLGLESKINEKLKLGVGIATGNPKDPRSRNVTLGTTGEATNTDWDAGSAKNIVLDYAYAEWSPVKWATLTGGKYQNPLWRPHDAIWKGDITPEGVTANFNFRLTPKFQLFMNDMLFILRNPDTNGGKQPIMAALQPGFSTDITDKINLKTAVTAYIFTELKGSPKFVYSKGSAPDGNTLDASSSYKYNYNSVNPSLELAFKEPFKGLVPYASIFGDYIYNTGLPSDATGAGGFDIGFKFGAEKVSDWKQWQARIVYSKLGRDCWVDAFTDSDRYSGKTNSKAWEAILDYGLGKNTWLSLDYYYAASLTKRTTGTGRVPESLLQIDWNMKF